MHMHTHIILYNIYICIHICAHIYIYRCDVIKIQPFTWLLWFWWSSKTTSKSIKWSLRRFLRIKVVNPSPGALAIQVLVTHFCCFGSTFQPQIRKKSQDFQARIETRWNKKSRKTKALHILKRLPASRLCPWSISCSAYFFWDATCWQRRILLTAWE